MPFEDNKQNKKSSFVRCFLPMALLASIYFGNLIPEVYDACISFRLSPISMKLKDNDLEPVHSFFEIHKLPKGVPDYLECLNETNNGVWSLKSVKTCSGEIPFLLHF